MFFKHENSVEKQLLNIRNAFVSHHCFRNSSLSVIRYNLVMSNYKRMKRPRNLEFKKKDVRYNSKRNYSILYSKERPLSLMHIRTFC